MYKQASILDQISLFLIFGCMHTKDPPKDPQKFLGPLLSFLTKISGEFFQFL